MRKHRDKCVCGKPCCSVPHLHVWAKEAISWSNPLLGGAAKGDEDEEEA